MIWSKKSQTELALYKEKGFHEWQTLFCIMIHNDFFQHGLFIWMSFMMDVMDHVVCSMPLENVVGVKENG